MTSPSLQPRLVVRGRMTTASHGELSSIFGEAELSASFLMVALGHQHRACCGEVDDAALRGGARHEVAVSLRRIRAKKGLRYALGNALDLTGWCDVFHMLWACKTFVFLSSLSMDVVRVLELSRFRCSSSFQLWSPEAHVLLWPRHSAFVMWVGVIGVIISSVSCRLYHVA